MFKKNDGFTLVELIVVIAILAILAAVAVPAYSGYIQKANDAKVIAQLDNILTAAQAATASTGNVVKVVVLPNCDKFYIITDANMPDRDGDAFAKGDFRKDILAYLPSLDADLNDSPYYGRAWDTDGDKSGDTYNRYELIFSEPLTGWENSSFAPGFAVGQTPGVHWQNGEWNVSYDSIDYTP